MELGKYVTAKSLTHYFNNIINKLIYEPFNNGKKIDCIF